VPAFSLNSKPERSESYQLNPELEHIECDHEHAMCMVTGARGPRVTAPTAALPFQLAQLIAMRRQGGIHSTNNEELAYIAWRLEELALKPLDNSSWAKLITAAFLVRKVADR
jgi:hypothetical protein